MCRARLSKGVEKININLFYKLKTPEQNIIED